VKENFSLKKFANVCTDISRDNSKIKSSQNRLLMHGMKFIPLLDFDLSKLKGKKLNNVRLHLLVESEDYPLEIEISSVSHEWNSNATLFTFNGEEQWAGDKWLTDMIMSRGNSIYYRRNLIYDELTHMAVIDIPVEIVYSMIHGTSYGLSLLDCKSKVFANDGTGKFAVKAFNSEITGGLLPYLEIDWSDCEIEKPLGVKNLCATAIENNESFENSSAILYWTPTAQKNSKYMYYNVYISEANTQENRKSVDRHFIPLYSGGKECVRMRIDNLKADTVYHFTVTVCNINCESEPVFTFVKTGKTAVKPSVMKPLISEENRHELSWVDKGKLKVYITDELCKVNPISGNVYEYDPDSYILESEKNIKKYECGLFDGKSIHLEGAPGEKLAFQLVFENCKDVLQTIELSCGEGNIDKDCINLNRVWYLNCNGVWYPEVAVPLGQRIDFSIPYSDNEIAGQRFQSIFVDIALLEMVKPGNYTSSLEVRFGNEKFLIPINITVHDIKLDNPDFVFELMGYTPVAEYMDLSWGDKDYYKIEETYYRTAYDHNLLVNILPYRQSGAVHAGFAPETHIIDGVPEISDWKEWDEHFEKYLNGSFMHEKAGRNIPVSHMYIPFHENWPMPLKDYYKVKVFSSNYKEMINENKLAASNVEDDFMPCYREGIKKILKDFIRHVDEKGWKSTDFIIYLNNKYYWKDIDDTKRIKEYRSVSTGKFIGGSSWWCLDEPLLRDDWEAVAYYGKIIEEARRETGSGENVKFRVDISRYHLMFDYLKDVLDLVCLNSRMFFMRTDLAREGKRDRGEEYWAYGHLGNIDKSNLTSCLNIIDVYLRGAGGFAPWDNFGFDSAYNKPTSTAGFYPGKRFGLMEPAVSLRLKAARKGMEILKYLETYKKSMGYNDLQLKEIVEAFIDLDGESVMKDSEDAGLIEFSALSTKSIEILKSYIISELPKP